MRNVPTTVCAGSAFLVLTHLVSVPPWTSINSPSIYIVHEEASKLLAGNPRLRTSPTFGRRFASTYCISPFDALPELLRISSATVGVPLQGILVRKRRVPALSSKASPDWAEPPLNVPQILGTVETQPGVHTCGFGGLGAA